ncbi:MAG: Asp-tRNA(Asn)/Glu-tRNA(Gln) amidotransferase subunit GatB [Bacteroidia bacterium]|nr:Asp-tRNA(Asn)/Glu-tRNA(Gln) amidotransferase subunit GatB [Bacteroidia bacterium]MCX7763895.1 Asp-tRNA(Asn)/Glu-tRNA(Gln) amidotransferase subunit GatB [Bacteroidia bacterium]MDW8057691.1 Asp-tRNA(Asn)/Glu-tRNA(Gln) amidotransferase subunit GatB [Bacteroidia bacterium]
MQYEMVVGLEVHVQLRTKAKIFAPEAVTFGERPNSFVSWVSLGYPGTLPVLNRACVEAAIRLALALECEVASEFFFSRKNYFYPDLPKGYQITQEAAPLARHGHILLRLPDGSRHRVGIERIQLEEDTGKSLHDQDPFDTLLDYNRAGIGLVEIVSEPDIRTPQQAMAYLAHIRRLVRFLGISDGNMEEGSLRCDANISVRPLSQKEFGTRVEIKNLNSISALGKALEYEYRRQVSLLEAGQRIERETRTWDGSQTVPLREKETADDYRYFPEPDLPPIRITAEWLAELQASLPELPDKLFDRLISEYGLSVEDAVLLTEDRPYADYFAALTDVGVKPKVAASWINGPIRAYLNEAAVSMEEFPLPPAQLAKLIQLVEDRRVSLSAAREKIFPYLVQHPTESPEEVAQKMDLFLLQDDGQLEAWIAEVLAENPDKVETYRKGKVGLLGFFVGQVVRRSGGKADPREVQRRLAEKLA